MGGVPANLDSVTFFLLTIPVKLPWLLPPDRAATRASPPWVDRVANSNAHQGQRLREQQGPGGERGGEFTVHNMEFI